MESARRALLKTLAIGSGSASLTQLPTRWTTPVIESVMLPAHAQTTGNLPPTFFSGTGVTGQVVDASTPGGATVDQLIAATDRLLSGVVPSASAGQPGSGGGNGYFVCAAVDPNNGTATVSVAGLNEFDDPGVLLIRRGVLSLDGTPGQLTAAAADKDPCFNGFPQELTRPARINPGLTTAAEIVIEITMRNPSENPPTLRLAVPLVAGSCLDEPSILNSCD